MQVLCRRCTRSCRGSSASIRASRSTTRKRYLCAFQSFPHLFGLIVFEERLFELVFAPQLDIQRAAYALLWRSMEQIRAAVFCEQRPPPQPADSSGNCLSLSLFSFSAVRCHVEGYGGRHVTLRQRASSWTRVRCRRARKRRAAYSLRLCAAGSSSTPPS
jgi:hypothetical protein